VNYYPHHIGDYLRDTTHLSLLEHGAYRRMLDLYYASEKPLPLDETWLFRLVRADKADEKEAVSFVLRHFFTKCEDGWRSKRADEEIKAAYRRAKAARLNGKLGGRPKTQQVISGLANGKLNESQPETQGKAPNTNTKTKEREERASRLPASWEPNELLKAWFNQNRPDLDLVSTVANFRDHWAAASGSNARKLDWDAAFRTWARNEHGRGRPAQQAGKVAL
jgi:uncharacterized protein YdaU (DUF1376 family)